MKHLLVFAAVVFPTFAFAALPMGPLGNTIDQIGSIVEYLIPLMVSIAVLLFLWGIVKFIANAGDETARSAGKSLMIWGMVAIFVMVSFWGIIGYVQESLGLTGAPVISTPAPDISNPVPNITP